ncbi:MAG TPA: GspH/FimT family pseudopilin [Azoarcus taiwanensis]|nr:GspH/FimT family pseudopilin [Azoarcus taiwanensis]
MSHSVQRGVTLIELMIVLVILVILVAMAGPAFIDTLDRRRIVDATEALGKQVQQARMVAIESNRVISLIFDGDGSEWCFGLTDQNDCDCNVENDCRIPLGIAANLAGTDYQTVRASSAQFSGVSLAGAPGALRFEPLRGVRIGGEPTESARFQSARGLEAQVLVNVIGRVATCSPDGSSKIIGVKTCP